MIYLLTKSLCKLNERSKIKHVALVKMGTFGKLRDDIQNGEESAQRRVSRVTW
jgi:hypothetical protein